MKSITLIPVKNGTREYGLFTKLTDAKDFFNTERAFKVYFCFETKTRISVKLQIGKGMQKNQCTVKRVQTICKTGDKLYKWRLKCILLLYS